MDTVRSSTTHLREVEVTAKAQRRRFTAEYKRRILDEVAACAGERGAVGALLRREGLYSSHLAEWRRLAAKGQALEKKRGPVPKQVDPRDRELVQLRRELAKKDKRLAQAEAMIEVQKKLAHLLGITLPDPDEELP